MMTTPMERALKNLGEASHVVGPMPIKSGALQGLCALLAAEIIADAIKEAAPAKPEPLHITINGDVKDSKTIAQTIQRLLSERND